MRNISKKQIMIVIAIIVIALIGTQTLNNQSEQLKGSLNIKRTTQAKNYKNTNSSQKSDEAAEPTQQEQQAQPTQQAAPILNSGEHSYVSYVEGLECPTDYQTVYSHGLSPDNQEDIKILGAYSSIGCSFKVAVTYEYEYSGLSTYECISTSYAESASPSYNWSCISFSSDYPRGTIINVHLDHQNQVSFSKSFRQLNSESMAITRNLTLNPRKIIIQAKR
ncbi:hypothetical protein HOH51_00660 [bacterium]|jgi:Sec-independent protein translocase protein TatA|nr:hypothetical protein [bacterium]